jgi:hypothetical protein
MNGPIKLDYVLLAGLSSLVQCSRVRPEPTQDSEAPLKCRFLALPRNIRLDRKSLPGQTLYLMGLFLSHEENNVYSGASLG